MTLKGLVATEFNSDEGLKAAFAQSILGSADGAFDDVVDVEAAGRRRLADGAGVEISYTGVTLVDGTEDAAAASANVLSQASAALTAMIDDGSFLVALQASDAAFAAVGIDEAATRAAIDAATHIFVVTTPGPTTPPTPAPTPRPTLAGAVGGAESSTEATGSSSGGSGGGGGDEVMVAGGGAAAGAVLLLAAAAFFFYRRSKGSNKKQAARGGDIELGDVELEEGDDRSTMLKRHKDTSTVVQHGLTLASALLSVGSGLPFVGELCSAVQGCLGSAEEFGDKAEDVTIAARRVCDVLDMVQPCVGIKFHGTRGPGSRSISTQVHLMAKNIDRLEENKALVESKMRRLVDLLVEFNKAVRAFGKKGWMKRAWKMRGHVHSLGRLDKEIVAQLDVFRDVYKLATDNESMKRIYKIEASIDKLVAERVRQTGEPEGKVVAVLSNDPVAIASVAVDARVPPTELATELSEFRLEVKAGLSNLDKKMQQMLDGKQGDREEIAKVLAAVNAGVTRDKKLLAAVESGAARDKK